QALEEVIRIAQGGGPKNLLLLTDADAKIEGTKGIAEGLQAKRVKLSVLAIGQGSALGALRQIVESTGGTLTTPGDPKAWAAGLEELGRAAMPSGVERSAVRVLFAEALELPAREVSPWDRTWLKSGATPLARAEWNGESIAPAARWRSGTGEVAAVA